MPDSFALLFGIFAIAMLAKTYTLRNYEPSKAATRFTIFLAAFTIALWFVFPDTQNPHVRPAVKYIGFPVAVFGVPIISFASYILRNEKPAGFSIQDIAEILFLPIWLIVCNVAFLALNWVWI